MSAIRVGIVSETFPPYRHVSGTRAQKYARALSGMGHRVVVHTGSPPGAASSVEEVEGYLVVRVPSEAAVDPSDRPDRQASGGVGRLVRRARTFARLMADGSYGSWVRALPGSVHELGAPRCDVYWGIFGSASAHAAASRLARSAGAAWVADFKDDWWLATGPAGAARWRRDRLRLRGAVALTAGSRLEADRLQRETSRRVVDVYTGLDDEDLRDRPPLDLGPGFNIVFTGHTDPRMALDVATEGVRLALARPDAPDVRLHYFGHRAEPLRAGLGEAADRLVVHGFADRSEVLAAQRGADLLLHMPVAHRPTLCVKLLEYLASGRTVLMVPREPDPGMGGILRGDGLLDAGTADEVAARVVDEATRVAASGRTPDVARDLSEFHLDRQAMRLTEVLREVVAGQQGRRT